MLVLLVTATAVAAVRGGKVAEARSPGFGPGWQCTPQENGEPICIRPVAPSGATQQSRP